MSLSQLRACHPCHMRTHNHSVPHQWAAYASSDLHSSGDPLLQCRIRVMLSCSKVLKGTSSQQPHIWLTNYPCMPLSFIFWLSVCKFKPFHNITILINTCSTSEILNLAVYFLVPPYHHSSLPARDAGISSTVSSPLEFIGTMQNKQCLLSPKGLQKLLIAWWHHESW